MPSTYRLILPLPEVIGRKRLYLTLVPEFVSGLPLDTLINELDPLFLRGPVPVRTVSPSGKRIPHKPQGTEVARNCTDLNLLHNNACVRIQDTKIIGGRLMRADLCEENFDPVIIVRDGFRCPANVEFLCDKVVLDELASTMSRHDVRKTWTLA